MKNKLIDTFIFCKYLLLIWIKILGLVLSRNPVTTIRLFGRYPWMITFLKFNGLYLHLCRNRKGRYLEATALTIYGLADSVGDYIFDALHHPEKVVLIEAVMSPEIFHAMGLLPFGVEILPIILLMVDENALADYIDKAEENYGIPADICSIHKATIGAILKKQLVKGRAAIGSNTPCDVHLGTYSLMEIENNMPFYRLDAPYNFTTDSAVDYFAGELKGMITWLELHTQGRMDWNKLRETCEGRNRMVELSLEYWETLRAKPAPIAGEAAWLPHWCCTVLAPGSPAGNKLYEKLLKLAQQNMEQRVAAVPNEKYRVLLWNMPVIHFMDLSDWAERTWGVSVIMESISFNRIPFIDTSTNESILKGLAKIYLYAPMARHSRGPAENYMDDLFYAYQIFNTDMLWVGANIGCKKTAALFGMLREKCREAGIPMLDVNMDIGDPRGTNHDMIKEQINHFMENTMKASRLC